MTSDVTLNSEQVRHVIGPIYRGRHWIQLVGILLIINGSIITVTGIGVLIAWLPIWLGVLLLKVAQAARIAWQFGDANMLALSLKRLKTTFTIMGVTTLLLLGGTVWLIYRYYSGSP